MMEMGKQYGHLNTIEFKIKPFCEMMKEMKQRWSLESSMKEWTEIQWNMEITWNMMEWNAMERQKYI